MRTRTLCISAALAAVSVVIIAAAPQDQDAVAPVAQTPLLAKVYDVADLVAPIRIRPRELAQAVTLAEWSAAPADHMDEQLFQLGSILQLALPKESWEENNGAGAIAVYPDKMSLVIRQTADGHRAIEQLLKDLRQAENFEIELAVDMIPLEGMSDEKTLLALQKLAGPLSDEDAVAIRQLSPQALQTKIRIENGHTAVGSGVLQSMARFTAVVVRDDRRHIDLRLDNITDDAKEGKYPWTSQNQTIPLQKTAGFLVSCDGGSMIFLVTPKIVEPSAK